MEAIRSATLRLFKAVPVEQNLSLGLKKLIHHVSFASTVKKGFVLDPAAAAEYRSDEIVDEISSLYGRDGQELNQAFHKSFAKVRDASIGQLVIEQLVHYLTTYGAEAEGAFDQDSVYVPSEELNVPGLDEGFRLIVIRGLTKDELRERLLDLLSTGAALHEQTVKDAVTIAKFVGISDSDLDLRVNNREVRSILYDHLGIVPGHPEEFLRFLVYKATGKTLLIKNRATVEAIKNRENDLNEYFTKYLQNYKIARLGEIFLRYKPLWLAFRTTPQLRSVVNDIRRSAVTNHKPMPEDLLNNVTAKLKRGEKIGTQEIGQALSQANNFRKARLAYALKFRTSGSDSILYRIRNGKSWAADFEPPRPDDALLYEFYLATVLRSISDDIRPDVDGKKVFVPEGLTYGLPATEKQFTGTIPTGSWVSVKNDLIVGVHWTNTDTKRVDLDLSLANAEGKYGWDGSYRSGNREILYSGDQTDAPKPHGASEVFHVGAGIQGSWLLNVNHYNRFGDLEDVPFKIVVGQADRRDIHQQYLVDPNKMIAFSNSVMDAYHKNLGFVVADEDSTRFYFAEFQGTEQGRSFRLRKPAEQARKFLLNYYTGSISLNDVLKEAGAEFVKDPAEADIDLSLEVVDKSTFLDLLTNGTGKA